MKLAARLVLVVLLLSCQIWQIGAQERRRREEEGEEAVAAVDSSPSNFTDDDDANGTDVSDKEYDVYDFDLVDHDSAVTAVYDFEAVEGDEYSEPYYPMGGDEAGEEDEEDEEEKEEEEEEDASFEEYFVHNVSGFHTKQSSSDGDGAETEEEETETEARHEDEEEKVSMTPWKEEEEYMNRVWPKYPLFVIIMGGYVR